MTCSHCLMRGHAKRKCPERDQPRETLVARRREHHAKMNADRDAVAAILGRYAPEDRVIIAHDAFTSASFHYERPSYEALRQREREAEGAFKGRVAGKPGLVLLSGGS